MTSSYPGSRRPSRSITSRPCWCNSPFSALTRSAGWADHGTFTTNGGSGLNAAGGQTEFFNSSTANNATLTANAGTVIGAFGGFTAFWDTSAANSATLIANGGPGQGGGIFFFVSSTGEIGRAS